MANDDIVPTYIAPPIETDPDVLAQSAFDRLAALIPGWEPAEGNLDTIMLETTADMAAAVRDLASQVPTALFRWFGATVLGIAPFDDAPAYGNSTWFAKDAAGYTIDAGTQVTIPRTGNDSVGFEVVSSVDIIPGDSQTATGAVELRALVDGTNGNALIGTPTPVDSIPWLDHITLAGPTDGGTDAETDDEYLDRLVADLELLSPRPIIARDFATLYRINQPEVFRAVALDTYDPDTSTFGNEKMVTVVGITEAGEPVSSPTKAAGIADLESQREANFIVKATDANYTSIDVAVEVSVLAGYTTDEVIADVEAEVTAYLQPSNWGRQTQRSTIGAEAFSPSWINESTVYYLELTTLVNNVPGVDRVVTLAFGPTGGTQGQADVALAGAAPLTRSGTVEVTAA